MSELDDLRRVAYGRTSSAADEAAAEDARARLALHDAAEQRERAAREADALARARAAERTETPAEVTSDEPVAIAEPSDEPGYLRRLVGSWRVWVVPALAAFVAGVVLTVASVVFLLGTGGPSTTRQDTNTSQRFIDGSEVLTPGDLALATALLARAQTAADLVDNLDPSIEPTSTHLLRSTTNDDEFAAMSTDGDICLISVRAATGDTITGCSTRSVFTHSGVSLDLPSTAGEVTVLWNGIEITETPVTSTTERLLGGAELLDPGAVVPNTVNPGDLAAAAALFAQPQQPDDVTDVFDSEIDAASTRLVHSSLYGSVFAAKRSDDHICLLLVKPNIGPSSTICVNESTFVAQGVSVDAPRGARTVRISWDGVTATDSAAK